MPAFNASLEQLQNQAGGAASKSPLDSLVAWEVPSAAPTVPVSPNVLRNIELALAAGLAAAVGLAFLIEHLDNTIKTADDITSRLHLPLLGTAVRRSSKGRGEAGSPTEMIAMHHSTDPLAEQYRNIRTNISFSRAERPVATMVVTSAIPGGARRPQPATSLW